MFRSVLFVIIVCLAACSSLTPTINQPVVSENDSRTYRVITLPNQLQALLVSDSLAQKAAASLDVNVGSRQDFQPYYGLAHFLEHMLFLGTEKYPKAGDYQAFINDHGGSHNAYTSFEHTNYFFDIEVDSLAPALDRFAQFFIAPLFNTEYVDRERHAVHSEYLAKLKTDSRKSLDVFKQIVNPAHPFSTFSVGSLDTLQDTPSQTLQEALQAYYQRNYSANIMKLVVVGRESLDELEAMVTRKFSAIKNKQLQLSAIEAPLFTPHFLPKQIFIIPEKETRTLELNFPIPDTASAYRSKPTQYLGHLLGHEGEGSLLSFLKKQQWAKGLRAGEGFRYQGGASFNVRIELTPLGLENRQKVVEAFFQAVARINAEGVKSWVFEEQGLLADMQFRFQESLPPAHYSRQLAHAMHSYPIEDLLRGPYRMDHYDAELIRHFLAKLSVDNMLLTVTAPELPTIQTSPYYQTLYSVVDIAPELLATWSKVVVNPEIQMPGANEFVAKDFRLIDEKKPLEAPPELLVDFKQLKLWFKNDDNFQVPKGVIKLNLSAATANRNPRDFALLSLLTAMLNEQLNEYVYPAGLAGLQYSLHPHMRGMGLQVSGFSEKQALLFRQLLRRITTEKLDERHFLRIKRDILRRLANEAKLPPYQLAMHALSELLIAQQYASSDVANALEVLTLDDVKQYRQDLMASVVVKALLYGNFQSQEATALANMLREAFPSAVNESTEPKLSVTKLTKKHYSFELDSEHHDAALLMYQQADSLDKQTRVAIALAAQILKPGFYTQLRTEQQLGYIVSSGVYPVMDVPGWFFIVQSPVASAAQLQQRISAFLQVQQQMLMSLDHASFERHRKTLKKRLQEQPQNLYEQAGEYWDEITKNNYTFDTNEQLVDALEQLSLESWIALLNKALFTVPNSQLWIYSQGKSTPDSLIQDETITSSADFKQQKATYSFPQ